MFEKSGKFYADWRDATGKRLRKSFTSKRAALQHEAEKKSLAHPKHKALRPASRPFSAPNSRSGNAAAPTMRTPRGSSSPLPVPLSQVNSQPAKSSKRLTTTKLVAINTRRK